jgi:hypothetical protein
MKPFIKFIVTDEADEASDGKGEQQEQSQATMRDASVGALPRG